MMKKRILSLLLVSAMTVGLTACGSGSGSGTEAANSQNTAAAASEDSVKEKAGGGKKKLTVTFKDDGQGENHPWYKWLKSSYEAWDMKDSVELEIAPIVAQEGDYYTKIALQLADKNTCPDLVFEDTFQLPNDVSAGYLTNLDDYLKDYKEWSDGTYYESMKKGVTASDGSVYGVPYCTDTRGLWYNKEIFKQAGLPEDWQPKQWSDIVDACVAIKDKCPDVVPFWCNSGVATGEATSMQTYEMLLYGTGERLLDENGKWIVKSQAILDSLGFIQQIYQNGYGPSLSLVLNGQASNTSRREYLPQSKLAISLDGGWIAGNWNETGASPWPEYEETMGFVAMPTQNGQEPGIITLSGGWALSIPENADAKDEAFAFLTQMMQPPAYTESVIAQGNIVVRADAAEDENYISMPFKKEATELLESADFRPQNDQYSVVTTCIQAMVEAVASGGKPEDAMAQYATDVARAVGDENVVEK